MIEWLGWVATAVWSSRRISAGGRYDAARADAGALVWAAYGLIIGAYPMVVANVLVIGAAAWATARDGRLTSLPDA